MLVVVRRVAGLIGQALITIAVVCTFVFVLVRLIPGDPVLQILGNEATPESIAALREQMHLNDSLWSQFVAYIGGLVQGDLGTSLVQRSIPVTTIIGQALPSTLVIVAAGLLVGVTLGVILGLRSALTRFKGVDIAIQTWTILSYATPTFLFALILILIVSLTLQWLPAGGWAGVWPDNAAYVVLPAIALGVNLAPKFIRTVRQKAIEVMEGQFMEAAYARGLSRRRLDNRHVLPNSLLPVITLVGMSIGGLLTNAVVVEAVFNMPGIGAELARAVSRRDYPVIQGIVLISSVAVLLGNLIAEFVYTIADPRARTR